jgi:hypothetical protein
MTEILIQLQESDFKDNIYTNPFDCPLHRALTRYYSDNGYEMNLSVGPWNFDEGNSGVRLGNINRDHMFINGNKTEDMWDGARMFDCIELIEDGEFQSAQVPIEFTIQQ